MKKIAFLAIGLLAIACQPKIIEVVEETTEVNEEIKEIDVVEEASIDMELVKSGFKTYENKCGQCHEAFIVDNITEKRWDEILNPMLDNAKLSTQERVEVTTYINYERGN